MNTFLDTSSLMWDLIQLIQTAYYKTNIVALINMMAPMAKKMSKLSTILIMDLKKKITITVSFDPIGQVGICVNRERKDPVLRIQITLQF